MLSISYLQDRSVHYDKSFSVVGMTKETVLGILFYEIEDVAFNLQHDMTPLKEHGINESDGKQILDEWQEVKESKRQDDEFLTNFWNKIRPNSVAEVYSKKLSNQARRNYITIAPDYIPFKFSNVNQFI